MEQKIIKMIKELPKEALASILSTVVVCCIRKNTFNGKKVSEIVASIEAAHNGE